MEKSESHIDQLAEIRNMMERSSKFISLSGFSGIWVGCVALLGTVAILIKYSEYFLMRYGIHDLAYPNYLLIGDELKNFIFFVLIDSIIMLLLAIGGAILFTANKARKKKLSIWDNTAKRFLVSLLIPLVTGGVLSLISIYHGILNLAGPFTLIFYGLALFNAGRYSLIEIRYLGLLEIVLGLLASFFIGYTAIFWVIGFGFLHIFYGIWMYFKYDRDHD